MTKRSLTDMLRAETQKAAIEPETELKVPTVEATEPKATAAKKTVAKVSTTTDSSPALEALVNELKADLEKSRDRVEELQQQVTTLQTELKASQAHGEQLKGYPEQVNQLKTELDRVKKDNLQLAEANIKLTQAAKEATAITQSRPQLDIKQANQNTNPEPEPKLTAAQEQAAHLTRILRRPVGSNRALSKVSDKNIGWFD